jgi:hypothetical protein
MAKSRSRRRIENFALIGLLAVVLTAVGMTLHYVHSYWQDVEACSQLQELGAQVGEHYEVSTWWQNLARTVGLSPTGFERTTYAVRLHSPSAAAEALRTAARLSELVELGIYNAQDVDDDTLAAVRHCTHVRRLELSKTGITDDGLKHLSGWSQLQNVYIYGSPVTHEGILFLVGLPSVQSVSCDRPSATGVTLDDLVFTGPAGTAPQLGQAVNVSGRLSVKYPIPAGTPATVQVTVIDNHDENAVRQLLSGSALVTFGATNQAAFSLTAANTVGNLRPGRNSVYVIVMLRLKAMVLYQFDRIPLIVGPENP